MGYPGYVNSPDLLYESYDSQSRRQVGDLIQNETAQHFIKGQSQEIEIFRVVDKPTTALMNDGNS